MHYLSWTLSSFECDLLLTMASGPGAAVLLLLMLMMDSAAGAPTDLLTDPLTDPPTDLLTEVPSGAGDEGGTLLLSRSPLWRSLLDATHRHEQEFKREFPDPRQYLDLDDFTIASLPEDCRNRSMNMEGCLRRLVQGLQVFQVYLRHVEREYPLSEVLPNVKHFSDPLINATKLKMRKPDAIKALSQSQEDKLLEEVNHSDPYHRKMFAHNVLRKLHEFLRESQMGLKRRETRPQYLSLL